MKAGTKLKSAVCDTEVMVIRAGRDGELTCGGAVMATDRPDVRGAVDPAFASGTVLGKRYQDAEGAIELLCIKGGAGALAIDGVLLELKDVKPRPSSD